MRIRITEERPAPAGEDLRNLPRGTEVDVPEAEAIDLCQRGMAIPVPAERPVEKRAEVLT